MKRSDIAKLGPGARLQVAHAEDAARRAQEAREEALKAALIVQAPGKRKGKFHNRPCVIDRIVFDSRAEGKHYLHLKDLQNRRLIKNLQVHKRYPLTVAGVVVCHIEPDFVFEEPDGTVRIHDTKAKGGATTTPLWRLKAKMFKAIYRIQIEVIEL